MFGLSFLNTLFLWGIAAAAVPLIIHLIKRNRAVKLPFAAMRFLQIKPNERVKSQKLKQFLLLLMRMLALAALAFAFTRPFFQDSEKVIWSEQPKAAAILIDNSLSMSYGDRFNAAVAKTKELLASFKPGDKVSVFEFSENARMIADAEQDFTAIANQIGRSISVSNRGTNYLPAIQAAESFLLESPFQDKKIYLISDLQSAGLQNVFAQWQLQAGIQLEAVPVAGPGESNVAITELLVTDKDDAHRRKDVLARISNFGESAVKAVATLKLNGKAVAKRNLSLPANEETLLQFNRVQFPAGLATGEVEVQTEEEIGEDNRYYFVSESRNRAEILAVNGEPNSGDKTQDELFFVERAINVPKLAKYALVQVTPQRLSDYDFANYRAVLLANVKDLSREDADRLAYYVRGGGGVIITLGDRTNPTIFNRLLQDLTPATLIGRAFTSADRQRGAIVAEIDYQHPIFKVFADPGHGDPSVSQFFQYFQSEPIKPEAVLASFDDGIPALVERNVGAGKVLLFTSTIDSEWNNLPVKAIFLPFLYQMLDQVAAAPKGQKSYLVGQPVTVGDFARDRAAEATLEIEAPSGKVSTLSSKYFDGTEEPGIYQVRKRNQSRRLGVFAVNVDPKESDLTRVSQEDLQARFLPGEEQRVQVASMASSQINSEIENRQKLWRFAILMVIALLIGETWLANRTYR